jgi:hypothetical protein
MAGAGLEGSLTARAWRQVARASAAPGYGYRYRRWVLDSLKYIDVQDLATGGDHIPELGDVYVDLALISKAPDQVTGSVPGLSARNGAGEEAAQRHTIGELLDSRPRVVLALIGQPGSGKSTLLSYAARRSAHWSVRGAVPGRAGRRRVPVLIALREHAQSIVADPAISLARIARAAVGARPGAEPAGWWERQLRLGRCVVLLDGLDEVARVGDRHAVADWVDRQIATYSRDHFVITSRPYGLPSSLTAQADLYVIRPFTAEQVQLFLDRWYLTAELHATGATGRGARRAVRLRAQESASRLAILLREHPALYDLAVNPLLLTMIATAHRYRGALPASRADLYGEICQVLLSRRAQAKELPELLPWPAKQTLLGLLAYQMMRDHVSDLSSGRVLEILGPLLERFGSSVTGTAFLDDVSRNGLLVEAPTGRYSFAHLTFQEYLAARHVSASPDLVKSLADNVDDPWWHETILLYAATGDSSPIVRACLDNGTIPALTLAFDCTDASTEIDPELRRRLDRERARAYEPGCSAAHRRLIAGVQATRLARRTLTTAAGTRICARPVPADLYWLFLADTKAPQPDSPCEPGTDLTATGMWGGEAQAFVTWLNSITAAATGIEVRLPRPDELQEEGTAGTLASTLPDPVTSAWTQPQLQLWLRPGQPHPHELPGASVRRAIAADARNTTLLPQVLTAAILDVTLRIIRDLDDARALTSALADDLEARAHSDGQLVDLMHAHIHAIVLTYAHALELIRAGAITRTCAVHPDLIRTLNLTPARGLADAIAANLAGTIHQAHSQAVELADFIDLDMSVLSAFDFDIGHATELAGVHATALDRAHAFARGLLHVPSLGLAEVFGIPSADGLDPALALPGLLGLPLRWVAEGPLASILLQVLAGSGDPYQAFSHALSAGAGIDEGTRLRAALGRPVTDRLRSLASGVASKNTRSSDWNAATVLGRLTDVSEPMATVHQPPSPADAAALRAVAVGLADGAQALGPDAVDALRTLAATVTLVEKRAEGEAKAGESIILALVLPGLLPGVPGQVDDELVADGLLVDGAAQRRHRGGQGRVPRGRLRGAVQVHLVGALLDGGLIVGGAEAPGLGAVPGDDGARDADARPVEVAVVAERAVPAGDRLGQPVKGGRRLALGADDRRGAGAQVGGCPAQHRRVLADVHAGRRDGDRQGDQLVEGDVEGRPVRLRRGKPLPEAVARGLQVQHQNAAGQVVNDDPAAVPQVAPLLRRLRPVGADAAGERAQHQGRQGGAVAERLGVTGDRRRQLRQLRGRRLQPDALLDPLKHPGGLPHQVAFAHVDQPGQRPVGGQLREPGLEPAAGAQHRLIHRTNGGFASVRQLLPLGWAVLQRRAEQAEEPDEPVAGDLADRLVEVGQADREDADALGAVLAGDADDGAAFPVVRGLDGDRAGEVPPGSLQGPAGGVEEAPELRARVPAGGRVLGRVAGRAGGFPGSVRAGLVFLGLVFLGLVFLGLVFLGLACCGRVRVRTRRDSVLVRHLVASRSGLAVGARAPLLTVHFTDTHTGRCRSGTQRAFRPCPVVVGSTGPGGR